MTRPTCWTLVDSAGRGDRAARVEFVELYTPAVRAYLGERWRHSHLAQDIDDATQEVFVECFRTGGALERADGERANGARANGDRTGGFRAFLYGVARNVCRRVEARESPGSGGAPRESALDGVEAREERLSVAFDRAWARTLVRAAAELQEVQAKVLGADALRRVELLRLRFREDLPIRTIAERFGLEADRVHHEYARAREEFREALIEVVQIHHPRSRAAAEAECAEILALLA
jgi:RNA polymerase sigma factor (sigma-70 family)